MVEGAASAVQWLMEGACCTAALRAVSEKPRLIERDASCDVYVIETRAESSE